MNEWIAAGIAVVAGVMVGSIAGRITQHALGRPGRPDALRTAAAPIASLAFSVCLVAGLMTALGFVNRESLDQIPEDLVGFLPRLLSAAIVMIGANVVAQLARAAVERMAARLPGSAARTIPLVTKAVILTFGVILGAAQLGVDTTVVNIAVAAVLFGLALAGALMVGLGSRPVTGEVAAGRALRRVIHEGDVTEVAGTGGRVVSMQPVAIEVDTGDGTHVLVPNSTVLDSFVTIRRANS